MATLDGLGPKGVKMQSLAAKVLSKQPSIHVRPGEVFNASKAPAGRKDLGNEKVNIGKDANVAAQTKPIKKPTVKASCRITRKSSDAEYPEIEKFFPYDPLDLLASPLPDLLDEMNVELPPLEEYPVAQIY